MKIWKNTKVWSKIPYATTDRFSWKNQKPKTYSSVFALEKDGMFWKKDVESCQNALKFCLFSNSLPALKSEIVRGDVISPPHWPSVFITRFTLKNKLKIYFFTNFNIRFKGNKIILVILCCFSSKKSFFNQSIFH